MGEFGHVDIEAGRTVDWDNYVGGSSDGMFKRKIYFRLVTTDWIDEGKPVCTYKILSTANFNDFLCRIAYEKGRFYTESH